MSDTECLVLGLLSQGYRYGHELDKVYQRRHMDLWTKTTRVSMYQALARMEKKGWVSMQLEKVGNFPERKVYSLTSEGEKMLEEMVAEHFSSADLMTFDVCMALNYFQVLPTEKTIACLQERLTARRQLLETLPVYEDEEAACDEEKAFSKKHNLALVRGYYMLEVAWLENLIDDLRAREEKNRGETHEET